MCFSAIASFTSSAIIGVVAITTFTRTTTPGQRILATIPLLFAAQQAIEGCLWLSFMHSQYMWMSRPATYMFLAFAQVLWPLIVPLAALMYERQEGRKKILKVLMWIGVAASALLLYGLITYPVLATASDHHIRYVVGKPAGLMAFGNVLYFIAAVVPLFVSGSKGLRWFGAVGFVSYVISWLVYKQYVVSVWCFFAAIISLMLYFIIVRENRQQRQAVATN